MCVICTHTPSAVWDISRMRQSKWKFSPCISCFSAESQRLLCREFHICTEQSCPELWARLKLFTQCVITLRCIKRDFYVIILHEKSIVLVCLFRFIEHWGCVTAVTICGRVAANLKFERLWTQVAICVQTHWGTLFSLPVLGEYLNIAGSWVLHHGAVREMSGYQKTQGCPTKKRNYGKKNVNYRLEHSHQDLLAGVVRKTGFATWTWCFVVLSNMGACGKMQPLLFTAFHNVHISSW